MCRLSKEPTVPELPMAEFVLVVVAALLSRRAVEGKRPLQAAHTSIGDNKLLDIALPQQQT